MTGDHDREGEPLGDRLDALGVTGELDDGDLVAGAVVLLKVIEDDGQVRMQVAWSDGMSWLERYGMLAVAIDGERERSTD